MVLEQEPMRKKCSLQNGSHWTRYKNHCGRNVLNSRVVTEQDTRTNAEDPNNFMPSPGKITQFHAAGGLGG
jgi:hypothetical protein